MIYVTLTRTSQYRLHVLCVHVDYRIHPSRSWTLADFEAMIPDKLTAAAACRMAVEELAIRLHARTPGLDSVVEVEQLELPLPPPVQGP